jgi:hypothetical protein
LDWSVVGRKGIDEQEMAKIFQNQKGAFDEGTVVRQVLIVPNKLSLERREVDRESEEREDDAANPDALEERAYFAERRLISNAECRTGS